MAVNDVFVMNAWGKSANVGDKVLMLADGNAEYAKALGLELNARGFGMGLRGQRFAIIVKDGVATHVNVEAPGEFKVSAADYVLASSELVRSTNDRSQASHHVRPPFRKGLPVPEDFGADETAIPTPGPGQFLSRTVYLSLDPYYRNVMKNNQLYTDRLAPGDVMVGETVAQVMESRNPEFRTGEYVAVRNGWQQYALSSGQGVRKLDPAGAALSTALGVLGMPGLTG